MIRQDVIDAYLPTIGIECHVQFNTATKLFAAISNDDRGAAPNTLVSPLCFGLPGTLPVLNQKAVELAVQAGHALNAGIANVSSFDRKHYFYPDLPKGYQITQFYRPIVLAGHINVPVGDDHVKVRIHHAHLEEDAGKSTHPAGAPFSLVDLNRAGTPLLEIVSEPDMHTAAQAKGYAQELYLLMKYAGVTHGDLSQGNMRFDVNVSVAKHGAKTLGTRAEVKNLNSFRAVERAVEYEVRRQIELLEKGEAIQQETRGWNEAKQKTVSQRSKEQAQDYRYMPEPDVPPVELTAQRIAELKAATPKLPPELRKELVTCGVDAAAAETLILQDALQATPYVGITLAVAGQTKAAAVFAAKFLVNRHVAVVAEQKEQGKKVTGVPTAQQFIDVYNMYQAKQLSSNNADGLLFVLAANHDQDARQAAEQAGMLQENNTAALGKVVQAVLAESANQKAVADVRAGELKAIGFLVGQVMKASQGKANPALASQVIREQLGIN